VGGFEIIAGLVTLAAIFSYLNERFVRLPATIALMVFGAGKFMALFAMLFGAGLAVTTDKADAAGAPSLPQLLRRLGWLLVFGMLHAYLIWHYDILVTYAVTGFLLLWFRRCRPPTACTVGTMLYGTLVFLVMLGAVLVAVIGEEAGTWKEWDRSVEQEALAQLDAFRGGWWEQMPARAFNAIVGQAAGIPLFLFWYAGGFMLFGVALYRSSLLTGTRSPTFLVRAGMLALGGGTLLSAAGLWFVLGAGGDPATILLHSIWFLLATPLLATGYAVLLAAWCRASRPPGPVRRALAAAGRMAFSNYIGQSVLFGLLFYGHGFGLKGHLGFAATIALSPAVWLAQAVFSSWWLAHFRHGPLEWGWRSLARGGPQPIGGTTQPPAV